LSLIGPHSTRMKITHAQGRLASYCPGRWLQDHKRCQGDASCKVIIGTESLKGSDRITWPLYLFWVGACLEPRTLNHQPNIWSVRYINLINRIQAVIGHGSKVLQNPLNALLVIRTRSQRVRVSRRKKKPVERSTSSMAGIVSGSQRNGEDCVTVFSKSMAVVACCVAGVESCMDA